MATYRTRISEVFWCDPVCDYAFTEAHPTPLMSVRDGRGKGEPISWLDRLFMGGIVVPDAGDEPRALTILLSGPPGSGKTTLAAELCYRWAQNPEEPLKSLYISSESHAPWVAANAKDFGWPEASKTFFARDFFDPSVGVSVVSIKESTDFTSWRSRPGAARRLVDGLDTLLTGGRRGQVKPSAEAGSADSVPHVVVIDSLNTVVSKDRIKVFRDFQNVVGSGPKMFIVILDSQADTEVAQLWEFASDVVLRLDRQSSGYLVRTIEIVKARFQEHIWGVHQLKLYGGPPPAEGQPALEEDEADRVSRLMRAHPYRTEGGVFVFPSIHYFLSIYKRKTPRTRDGSMPSPLASLNAMLGGGFPKGRCTAFLGERGGHKSHLGYVQLLSAILASTKESPQKAIVVSLRDDEGMTKDTMRKILRQMRPEQSIALEDLERNDQLEIMYYPTGYITPEEFFHRLLLSISRMKQGEPNTHVTLLFNSLDQLSSRFPLCAREDIFVPAIVQMLTAEGVTSFFVAAQEPGQRPDYHGLESIAELILTFHRKEYPRDEYVDLVSRYRRWTREGGGKGTDLPERLNAIAVSVTRFAGGQAAGAGGVLELVDAEPLTSVYGGSRGLHFVPFDPRHAIASEGA